MIEIEHLTKRYGEHLAVDDLSFRVDSGQIYGFLGPNGAGKSTTMNIMTGCLSATYGHVRIDGHDIFEEPDKAKKLIGYLPEHPPLYVNETPQEYLQFVGEAKGLRGTELTQQIAEIVRQTKIESVAHRRISTLSKGYQQRVGIAQALLGSPKVIILDEPTVGLDPIQIIEIRDLIKELGQTHTVILSSHILSEVQAICDRILIIAKGKLIAFDTAENLERLLRSSNEINIVTEAASEEVQEILDTVEHITSLDVREMDSGFTSAQIKTACDDVYELSRAVFSAFAESRAILLEMAVKKANLEDVFIELTEASAAESEAIGAENAAAETTETKAEISESEVVDE